MATRKGKVLMVAATFLAFGLSQVYVQARLPGTVPAPQRTITATLKTKNNQPVTINGNSAGTGTTILTGATIETPDQTSAIIDLGEAGTVEIGPNSKIELSFDENGNIRVKLVRGCSVVRKKANAVGEASVATDTVLDATNPRKRQAGGCLLLNGQLGPFTTGIGVATEAGLAAAVGGGVGAIIILARGGNSSEIE